MASSFEVLVLLLLVAWSFEELVLFCKEGMCSNAQDMDQKHCSASQSRGCACHAFQLHEIKRWGVEFPSDELKVQLQAPTIPPELAAALAKLATSQQQQPAAGQQTPLPQPITLDPGQLGQLQKIITGLPGAAAAAPQASGAAAAVKSKPTVMRNTYGSQPGGAPAAHNEAAGVDAEEPLDEPSYGEHMPCRALCQ